MSDGSSLKNYVQTMRQWIGHERMFVPGVRAVIVNADGKILLQKRGDLDIWGLPGGSMELDETVLEALRREIWEETGITVKDPQPMGIYCGPIHRITYPNGDQIQCFGLAFIVRSWEGEFVADGDESKELRFFSQDEIPKTMLPTHSKTVEDYFQYKGQFFVD